VRNSHNDDIWWLKLHLHYYHEVASFWDLRLPDPEFCCRGKKIPSYAAEETGARGSSAGDAPPTRRETNGRKIPMLNAKRMPKTPDLTAKFRAPVDTSGLFV